MDKGFITIGGAREHNLKNISLQLPRNQLIVITGLSGSGKSSLAFDTLYAEGQRKYVESLSAYARQFLEQMQKPDVDFIEGLSPAISIEQRTAGSNPRSTIATTTEIYDYLRLLFASIGKPHCHRCGHPIASQTVQQIVDQILTLHAGTKLMLLAPLIRGRKGEHRDVVEKIKCEGFVRARIDGRVVELSEEKIRLKKTFKHDIEIVVDRLALDAKASSSSSKARLTDSVETALKWGDGTILTLHEQGGQWTETLYSSHNACIHCGVSYGEFTPRHFSFNSPYGACRECHGLGSKLVLDSDLIVPNPEKSIEEGAINPWRRGGRRLILYYKMLLRSVAAHYGFSQSTPFKDLPKKFRDILLYGSGKEEVEFGFWRSGVYRRLRKPFEGIIPNLTRLYENTQSNYTKERLHGYMSRAHCQACDGARLKPESLAVTIGSSASGKGISIMDVTRLSVCAAYEFFSRLELSPQEQKIAREIIKEILARLNFMRNVGLDYVTLDRESGTLSGGEAQRIRLATQIGAGLVGVLYILDEPSIGLHQRDNGRLLNTLEGLRDLGNTVIVVEHDEETIRRADYIVDLGPGAGVRGGYVVAQGTLDDLLHSPESLTAQYLRRDLEISVPKVRVPPKNGYLKILGARENNLQNIDVSIPLGCLVCVTGVSGSGKSTLVDEILRKALFRKFYASKDRPGSFDKIVGDDELDKVIVIDQSPIGRTPRSNPATYTGMFTHIRDLFARLPLSRVRGYGPGRYSFNVRTGRCEVCKGDGILRIEMHFLPDVYVTCETCGGKRYNRETLEVTYKGKNIADVLDMTVDEALTFFRHIPPIASKLQTLADVGLGYIRLGQQATTLSGGEAQRVKLSTELAKRATGRTLYILDEPTTGLHFADIHRLLEVLYKLRDAGNTVLVIEHNLDVVKTADYIIDLGPEGGEGGGRVIACGTPEKVAGVRESYTGQFLKTILSCTNTSPLIASCAR